MRIKICGIMNPMDARLAEHLGADYIGLIFAACSPRQIDVLQARAIIRSLKTALPVGVFVEQSIEQVEHIAAAVELHAVQLYNKPPRPPRGVKYIQTLRVRNRESLRGLHSRIPDHFVLDAYDPEREGGNGRRFDWSVLPASLDRVFLSGGIHAGNIREARRLRPYGIDVCSGVESRPGIKDRAKLEALFEEFEA